MAHQADYLIVGAGAVGMIFADQLLTETDATIAIVDRRATPGGHWNEAYPFVRLHQPSAYYGAGSRALGCDRIETTGFNRGNYELASGHEVLSYFDGLMRERFLPSGRVRYFPMSDYRGDGTFVSRLTGEAQRIEVRRKLIDATYIDTQIPATHTPSFQVADGVQVVGPKDLPKAAPAEGRYVILGGGKTAMDVGVWLLQSGVAAQAIRWVIPRDAWLINRDTIQPGEAFFHRTGLGQALQLEASAEAASLDDLFARLERDGQLIRLDPSGPATMYRGATISPGEMELLRSIKDVVRKGRVRRLETTAIVLEEGSVAAEPGDLYVDCTARGIASRPAVPIFAGDRITIQAVRANVVSLSAAVIAHVEAAYGSDAEKNGLCVPIPVATRHSEWPRLMLQDVRNARRWSADKDLRRWVAEHRLSGLGVGAGMAAPPDEVRQAILQRIREARPRAEANLARLAGEAEGRVLEPGARGAA